MNYISIGIDWTDHNPTVRTGYTADENKNVITIADDASYVRQNFNTIVKAFILGLENDMKADAFNADTINYLAERINKLREN